MNGIGKRLAMMVALSSGPIVLGCGGETALDTTTAEATVSGTIKIRGKAMDGGEVQFDPSAARKTDAVTSKIKVNADGTYSGKALVGGNTVRLAGPAVTKDPTLGYVGKPVDVRRGENTFDLEYP